MELAKAEGRWRWHHHKLSSKKGARGVSIYCAGEHTAVEIAEFSGVTRHKEHTAVAWTGNFVREVTHNA